MVQFPEKAKKDVENYYREVGHEIADALPLAEDGKTHQTVGTDKLIFGGPVNGREEVRVVRKGGMRAGGMSGMKRFCCVFIAFTVAVCLVGGGVILFHTLFPGKH